MYGPVIDSSDGTLRGTLDWDMKFTKGDIVEILLFFEHDQYKHCCLGYRKSGRDIVIGFDDLNINEYYALGVAMWSQGDCVQIVQ